jgi:hypothetical protein
MVNLQTGSVHYTTLTEAIDGLVGADPIPSRHLRRELQLSCKQTIPLYSLNVWCPTSIPSDNEPLLASATQKGNAAGHR